MPTLVITGHPCAGKSTFARILAERAILHKTGGISSTVIINEESSCPGKSKSDCYVNSKAEKVTREALKSDFDKYCTSAGDLDAVGGGVVQRRSGDGKKDDRKRLVILDSLNYIKGFRYEIHCIAKAAGERHGIVWVLNDPEVCKAWNNKRQQEKGAVEDWYKDDSMVEELMQRYEPPDERNRWDKPLYRADVGAIVSASDKRQNSTGEIDGGDKKPSSADAVLSRTLYDMHSLTEAMGPHPASKNDTQSAAKSAAAKSFKRSAASGFKRNPARAAKSSAAAPHSRTSGALTLEALESLHAANSEAKPENDKNGNAGGEATSKAKCISQSAADKAGAKICHKEPKTLEELADIILDSFLTDVAPLKEGKSTALLVNAGANVLHDVDNITQQIVTSFISEQRSAAALGGSLVGGKLRVPIGSGESKTVVEVKTNRSASVSELKRLRREYVKWLQMHPPEDTSEIGIATSFLSYVESKL